MIDVKHLAKHFVLYHQGATVIPVFQEANFSVAKGECVALTGASGAGKSTLMRMIYGNYLCKAGSIKVNHVEMVGAHPHDVMQLRRTTIGYVSQFLRVVPRVSTVDVVAEPLLAVGEKPIHAQEKSQELLSLLNIPKRLWSLSPTTFSGGEQQRVNIARGFVYDYPALLLDEPTASLDSQNRDVVLGLIERAKSNGKAIIGIFHDPSVRDQVCDRVVDVSQFMPEAAA